MYKLIFLGDKGSDALPYSNGNGGFILRVNDFSFHFDPGPGTLTKAEGLGINLANTNCVLVSHNHLTHCNDLNLVVNLMTSNGMDSRGFLISTNDVIYGEDTLGKKQRGYLARASSIKPREVVMVDTFMVSGLKTKHSVDCLGFKVSTEHFNLVYTGDTGYFNGIEKEYADANILIANCVKGFNSADENNLTADDVVRIILDVKPQLVILTHFGKSLLQSPQMYLAREIYRRTKIQTIAARDGLIIDPFSYSPELKQKSLSFY
ncbi:MBL fold metallo-hydrolase [Candidatus Woesearchaeota archaeon]|nr:MBL fold metallo-hydrolase [Candidatus Woesearchaeota archaeon]